MKAFLCLLFSVICLLCFSFPAQAGITLRVVAVNPADDAQTVPVKVYLPMEIKPEELLILHEKKCLSKRIVY